MEVKAKLRLVLGSLKDHAAIGKAVISGHSTATADVEVAILRCTDRSDAPVDDRFVHEILSLVANAPGSVPLLARKLSQRLEAAGDRVVALKTLLLLHRLLRAGDRRFELNVLDLYVSGELRLDLRWLPPQDRPFSFLRRYAAFLEERMGWVINPAGKLEPARPSHQRHAAGERSVETVLHRLSRCQTFLDRIIDCLPENYVVSRADRVTQSALNIMLRESFRVYTSFCDAFEAMTSSSSSDHKNRGRGLARSITERAVCQSQRLRDFYEDSKRIVMGKNLEYPLVRIITADDVSAMDGFIGRSKTEKSFRLARLTGELQPLAAPTYAGSGGLSSMCGRGEAVGGGEEGPPTTLFSSRLETKISMEWVAFDDDEGSLNSSVSGGAAEDCSVGSAYDLPLSWESFGDG